MNEVVPAEEGSRSAAPAVAAHVMVIDDDRMLCNALTAGLRPRGYDVTAESDPSHVLERLETDAFDAVVCDINMPGGCDGIELCRRIVAAHRELPVIVLTAFGSFDTAVAAIRAGAYDFLSKPVKIDALVIALERATERRRLRAEVTRLREEVDRAVGGDGIIGLSASIRELHELIARVAGTDASVLVTGESGTGKEMVARAIHRASARSDAPFVAINCAALPEALLESELFGHVRGAFTDAREGRPGLLRQGNGGTIFLDEIGDMPLGLQPKLLRVLQERTVRPVGGTHEVPLDVRVITATNRDLEAAVEERRFREDLFFRVNVVNIAVPPLRVRGSADILALADHFLHRFATQHKKRITALSPGAAQRLVAYRWPGNVRELMNCIEHAVTLARADPIQADDLPARIIGAAGVNARPWPESGELVSLEEMERHYIEHVLDSVGSNKAQAARILRIERKTLYRKLAQWGLRDGSST
jgi:two-component system response regulator HydG